MWGGAAGSGGVRGGGIVYGVGGVASGGECGKRTRESVQDVVERERTGRGAGTGSAGVARESVQSDVRGDVRLGQGGQGGGTRE